MSSIVLNMEQGSREWVEARLGIVTASEFDRLVTAGGKPSKAAAVDKYMDELNAEWWEGEPQSEFKGTIWTERGKALEPEAFDFYALQRGYRPKKVGLVYGNSDRLWACSPDGYMPEHGGGLELKCPAPTTHLGYLRAAREGEAPAAYRVQLQASMWITGARWWDFMSYCPGTPDAVLVRVEADLGWMELFEEVVPAFMRRVLKERQALRDAGWDGYMDTAGDTND